MAAHVRVYRRRRRQLRRLRRPRVFFDRSNPLEMLEEDEVFERYRFRPASILYILGLLPELMFPTQRNQAVPPLLQLLVTLRFLATGAIHQLIADSVKLSRATVNRIVRRTTKLLAALAPMYVKFPSTTSDDVKRGFAKIAGFPNVLGCIDGTFIRIQRPKQNEADYINRKGYHSLNVQYNYSTERVDVYLPALDENLKMCCDYRFMITSCYASWPGSVHDSRVFRSSALCAQFENGEHNGLLLGDSGYPCRHFLMTPFINPTTPGQTKYNDSLCRTRVLIEQTFGILKRRFQVLHCEQRNGPEQAVVNTVASVVLHNIGILRGDVVRNDEINIENNPVQLPAPAGDGAAMRNYLVNTFFS